jgi:cytoskeletal protein RodZ
LDSIGSTLKSEREKRGLSLADAHTVTKITSQNLAALEDDRFDTFPNRVYARAFLRDYANFLGLDSGPLLERYEEAWDTKHADARQSDINEPANGATNIVRGFGILVIVVIVGFAVYTPFMKYLSQRSASHPTTTSSPSHSPAPATSAPTPAPAPAPSPAPTAAPPIATPDGVQLTIAASEMSWIRVRVDGKKMFEGQIPAGKQMKWTAKYGILFRTGNAGGVRLYLNGKKLAPLGPSGAITSRSFVAPPKQGTQSPKH